MEKMIQGTGALMLSAAILPTSSIEIGEATKAGNAIRYFMQKPEAKGSSTPFTNNE